MKQMYVIRTKLVNYSKLGTGDDIIDMNAFYGTEFDAEMTVQAMNEKLKVGYQNRINERIEELKRQIQKAKTQTDNSEATHFKLSNRHHIHHLENELRALEEKNNNIKTCDIGKYFDFIPIEKAIPSTNFEWDDLFNSNTELQIS